MRKPTAEGREAAQVIALRIKGGEPSRTVEPDVIALADRYGEWIFDAITDVLTASTDGTYNQAVQDALRKRGAKTSRLSVVSLDGLPDYMHLATIGTVELLADLVPADFNRIPKDAGFSPVERDVWAYWIGGYSVNDMAKWLTKRNGAPYSPNHIYKIVKRTLGKAWNCPWMGWRTAMAEDIGRGKHPNLPDRISWAEVVRAERKRLPSLVGGDVEG